MNYGLPYKGSKSRIAPAIIYADPPYHSTEGYTSKNRATSFSTPDFLRWAAACPLPVYISEYSISDPRFRLVREIPRRSAFSAYKAPVRTVTERLYANPAAENLKLATTA